MLEKKKKEVPVTHFFNRRKYKVLFKDKEEIRGDDKTMRKVIASCDNPIETGKEIHIMNGQTEQDILDCLIHESLHVLNFTKHEKVVNRTASSIARLLWKMNYRRVNN